MNFEISGRPGEFVQLGDDDYLNVEIHDRYFAIAWTSDLDLPAAAQQLEKLFPAAELPTVVAFDSEVGRRSEETLEEFIRVINSAPDAFKSVRFAFDAMSLTWARADDSLISLRPDHTHGQIGLIARFYDPQLVELLLRDTGTEAIRSSAVALSSETTYVGYHIQLRDYGDAVRALDADADDEL